MTNSKENLVEVSKNIRNCGTIINPVVRAFEDAVKQCPERMGNGECYIERGLMCTANAPADIFECPCMEKTDTLCPECFKAGRVNKIMAHRHVDFCCCSDFTCRCCGDHDEVHTEWEQIREGEI